MSTPLFTIIIPIYNGQDVVDRALDSIYCQGLSEKQFEVICVDDCSPTMETYEVLINYTYNGIHPSNLKVLRHEVNKRQGGARNTAFTYAEGEYILYLDADDIFVDGCLQKLSLSLQANACCDVVMFDYKLINSFGDNKEIVSNICANQGFISEHVSGAEFIQKYPIPWTPWLYAYSREFLLNNKILFAEFVRFEDVDYVIKCTLLSSKIIFLPLVVYCHFNNVGSTSYVGNDILKFEDEFKLSVRLKNIAEDFKEIDKDAAMAAMNHHIFHLHDMLVKYLWRLRYRDIVRLLKEYPPYENSNDRMINFVIKHPRTYAAIAQLVRPILLAAIWMRNKLRKF